MSLSSSSSHSSQSTKVLIPSPRRRRFLQGLSLSALGIVGSCSRAPLSGKTVMDLIETFDGDNSELLRRYRDDIDSWIDPDDPRIGVDEPCEGSVTGPNRDQSRILEHERGYAGFLSSLELRHIKPHEVLRPHRNVLGGVANELPPESLWGSMAPTLKVADEIRERLASPLRTINSAYRCPAYNAACPGSAKHSFHMKNLALDLMFDCGPKKAFAMAKQLRSEGVFKGGIGLYPSFIHLDTRGYHATWGG